MADGISRLKLNVTHGHNKHQIDLALPVSEGGDILSVQHLQEKVQELTGVPKENQKLIYKGKSLTDSSVPLIDCGLKEGAKVLLIGKKPIPKDDPEISHLRSVEKDLEKEEKKLSDITYRLDGIHRGFLDKEKEKTETLKSLHNQLNGTIEKFQRMLENLDSLRFDEFNKEGRAKRKHIVDRILELVDRCDALNCGVKDMKASDEDS